jgi:NADPH2:quinone reductase
MRGLILHAFGAFDNLAIGEMPDPLAREDELLVNVMACAVNFADTLLVSGTYQFKPDLPFIPGKCPAGVIRAHGAKVVGFKPGDRVLVLVETGGFGDLVVAKTSQCLLLPPSLSLTDAASMSSAFDTAWIALRERAFMVPGENVLILGASSGVGLAAVQLAKAFGGKVLAGIANSAKGDVVRSAGADLIISCAETNLKDDFREQVLAATAGKGVDVVLDMLGGDVFDAAIRTVAWSGRIVVVGFASGRISTIKTNYFLIKNISLSGMQISEYRRRRPETIARCWQEIFFLYLAKKIKPPPTVVWSRSRCVDALAALRDRRAPGRIVLQQENI